MPDNKDTPAIDDVLAAIDAHQANDPNTEYTSRNPDPTPQTPQTSDPVASQFTWENKDRDPPVDFSPYLSKEGVVDMSPQGNIPSLSKVSVSKQGLPGGKARSNELMAQADVRAQPELDALKKQQDEEIAAQRFDHAMQAKAITDEGEVNQAHFDRLRAINQRETEFNKLQAETEQAAAAHSAADAAQYVGAYKEQLAAVKALAMQSGNPLTGLATSQKLGLGLAAFAQGFLATRGINIDVSGQIDRWVDRSIQEHQQMVQNARQGAQDQLSLWDIARKTSNDQYEARQRFRGFMVQAFQGQVQAEASKYGSEMASADASAKVAQLQLDADNVTRQIYDTKYNQVHAERQMQLNAVTEQGKLEVEKEKIWAELEKAKMAADAKNKQALIRYPDPTQVQRDADGKAISGGKYVAILNPNLPKEMIEPTNKTVTEATGLTAELHANLDKLRPMVAAAEVKWGPEWYKKNSSPEYQRIDNLRNLTIASILKFYSGSQAAEPEAKRFLAQLEPNTFYKFDKQRLGREIDDMDTWGHRKYVKTLESLGDAVLQIPEAQAEKLAPDGRPWGGYAGKIADSPEMNALETARSPGHDIGVSPIQKDLERMTGQGRHEVSQGNETQSAGGFSPSYLAFARATGAKYGTTSNREHTPGEEAQFDAIDHLALITKRPDIGVAASEHVSGRPTLSATQAVASAMNSIELIAKGEALPDGNKPDKELQAYAKHLLKALPAVPVEHAMDIFGSREQPTDNLPSGGKRGGDNYLDMAKEHVEQNPNWLEGLVSDMKGNGG